MTTRDHIIDRLAQHCGLSLVASINSSDRYLAVLILDDNTENSRIITSAPSREAALDILTDPPSCFCAEYLIDMDAPIDECVFQAYDDGHTVDVSGDPFPFNEHRVAFA